MPTRTVHPPDLTRGAKRKLLPVTVGAIILFTDGEEKGRQVPLIYVRTVIGRKFGDILLRDSRVSASHLAIEFRGDHFVAVDLGSSNGTFLGKERIRDTRLEPEDELRLGSTGLTLRFDPVVAAKLSSQMVTDTASDEGGLSALIQRELFKEGANRDETIVVKTAADQKKKIVLEILEGPDRGKRLTFAKPKITIGRIKADLNLKDPDASRKHALIETDESGKVFLRDLASTNGTFLNDRRITNAVVGEGDRIHIGSTTILILLKERK